MSPPLGRVGGEGTTSSPTSDREFIARSETPSAAAILNIPSAACVFHPAELHDQPLLVGWAAAACRQDRPQRYPVELPARHLAELADREAETHGLPSFIAIDLRIDYRQTDQASPPR